jgi:RNase adaptor protein for sRNA GlmZ degradation
MVKINIYSFSIKYRKNFPPPLFVFNFSFDCRCVKNPGRVDALKHQTGLDPEVQAFLDAQASATEFFSAALGVLRPALAVYSDGKYGDVHIGFSCTGGQHRSVYFAQKLHALLVQDTLLTPFIHHLDIDSKYSAALP